MSTPKLRFLIDAQLPPELARYLQSHGHEARAVRQLNLGNSSDATIWNFAKKNQWIIVTKDEDFVERVLLQHKGPSVVWLRIGNSTTPVLLTWFAPLLELVIRELSAGNRLVELQRRKII